MVKEVLDRARYQEGTDGKFGIHKLLSHQIYNAAFPLHEGPYAQSDDMDAFNGRDQDRRVLFIIKMEIIHNGIFCGIAQGDVKTLLHRIAHRDKL